MFSWIALTSMLTFSIWRIRRFSAMLAQNKIFANEKLMLIHLISFYFVTIYAVSVGTMLTTGAIEVEPDIKNISDQEKRYFLATEILFYVACTAQIGVIVTMMIIFIKHSKTISEAQ